MLIAICETGDVYRFVLRGKNLNVDHKMTVRCCMWRSVHQTFIYSMSYSHTNTKLCVFYVDSSDQ